MKGASGTLVDLDMQNVYSRLRYAVGVNLYKGLMDQLQDALQVSNVLQVEYGVRNKLPH